MESIENINDLSKMITDIKKGEPVYASNFFLFPDSINHYIKENRLYIHKINNDLFIICEENDYYFLYFFLVSKNPYIDNQWISQFCKPVLINLVFLDANEPRYLNDIEKYWINVGFEMYRINRRMFISSPILIKEDPRDRFQQNDSYDIGFVHKSDATKVLKLWKDYIDKYSSPLPDSSQIGKLIKRHQIIGAYSNSTKLIAALQFSITGKASTIDFLAVDNEFRRRGLAQRLLDFYLCLPSKITTHHLWVNAKNEPAIELYKKIGFSFDGKVSHQLLKF